MGSCRSSRSPAIEGSGIVARCDDIGPQRLIRIQRIERARLADVGQSLGEIAAVEIGEPSVVVGAGGLGIEPDRFAERYSIATFCPSTKPASFSPSRNAVQIPRPRALRRPGLRSCEG